MHQSDNELKGNGTWTYLLLTGLISSIFYFLIIKSGHVLGGGVLYAIGLEWSPGVAALLTLRIQKRSFTELGWNWGQPKYQLWSYLIPLAYSAITYLIVWVTGLGGFYNQETVNNWKELFGLGEISPAFTILLMVILSGSYGVIRSTAFALGEEIGWRGFLVPELYKKFSYTKTSLISGIIWSIYHYPILIFADYNGGTPLWYGLSCFTIMLISSCFIYTWLRMKSNSLWTGVILHASNNLFIQRIFTPLTSETETTKYIIDEFGIGLAIVSVIFGFYFWTKRGQLTLQKTSGQ